MWGRLLTRTGHGSVGLWIEAKSNGRRTPMGWPPRECGNFSGATAISSQKQPENTLQRAPALFGL